MPPRVMRLDPESGVSNPFPTDPLHPSQSLSTPKPSRIQRLLPDIAVASVYDGSGNTLSVQPLSRALSFQDFVIRPVTAENSSQSDQVSSAVQVPPTSRLFPPPSATTTSPQTTANPVPVPPPPAAIPIESAPRQIPPAVPAQIHPQSLYRNHPQLLAMASELPYLSFKTFQALDQVIKSENRESMYQFGPCVIYLIAFVARMCHENQSWFSQLVPGEFFSYAVGNQTLRDVFHAYNVGFATQLIANESSCGPATAIATNGAPAISMSLSKATSTAFALPESAQPIYPAGQDSCDQHIALLPVHAEVVRWATNVGNLWRTNAPFNKNRPADSDICEGARGIFTVPGMKLDRDMFTAVTKAKNLPEWDDRDKYFDGKTKFSKTNRWSDITKITTLHWNMDKDSLTFFRWCVTKVCLHLDPAVQTWDRPKVSKAQTVALRRQRQELSAEPTGTFANPSNLSSSQLSLLSVSKISNSRQSNGAVSPTASSPTNPGCVAAGGSATASEIPSTPTTSASTTTITTAATSSNSSDATAQDEAEKADKAGFHQIVIPSSTPPMNVTTTTTTTTTTSITPSAQPRPVKVSPISARPKNDASTCPSQQPPPEPQPARTKKSPISPLTSVTPTPSGSGDGKGAVFASPVARRTRSQKQARANLTSHAHGSPVSRRVQQPKRLESTQNEPTQTEPAQNDPSPPPPPPRSKNNQDGPSDHSVTSRGVKGKSKRRRTFDLVPIVPADFVEAESIQPPDTDDSATDDKQQPISSTPTTSPLSTLTSPQPPLEQSPHSILVHPSPVDQPAVREQLLNLPHPHTPSPLSKPYPDYSFPLLDNTFDYLKSRYSSFTTSFQRNNTLTIPDESLIYCVTHLILVASEFGSRPFLFGKQCTMSEMEYLSSLLSSWLLYVAQGYPTSHALNRELVTEIVACLYIAKHNGVLFTPPVLRAMRSTVDLCLVDYYQRWVSPMASVGEEACPPVQNGRGATKGASTKQPAKTNLSESVAEKFRLGPASAKECTYIPIISFNQDKDAAACLFAQYHTHYLIALLYALAVTDTFGGSGHNNHPTTDASPPSPAHCPPSSQEGSEPPSRFTPVYPSCDDESVLPDSEQHRWLYGAIDHQYRNYQEFTSLLASGSMSQLFDGAIPINLNFWILQRDQSKATQLVAAHPASTRSTSLDTSTFDNGYSFIYKQPYRDQHGQTQSRPASDLCGCPMCTYQIFVVPHDRVYECVVLCALIETDDFYAHQRSITRAQTVGDDQSRVDVLASVPSVLDVQSVSLLQVPPVTPRHFDPVVTGSVGSGGSITKPPCDSQPEVSLWAQQEIDIVSRYRLWTELGFNWNRQSTLPLQRNQGNQNLFDEFADEPDVIDLHPNRKGKEKSKGKNPQVPSPSSSGPKPGQAKPATASPSASPSPAMIQLRSFYQEYYYVQYQPDLVSEAGFAQKQHKGAGRSGYK